MPRQNKRQTQLPAQTQISDFFGKAYDKPADTPSGAKRTIVDEPAEANKKQITMSCSDTGEGLASVGEYLLAPSPPSPSYETKTNASLPKETLTSLSDETKTNTRLPKEALTSPSDETKTYARLPKEALTNPSHETKNTSLPTEAMTSPSKKAMTTLESSRVIPSSQEELDDEEMSFETFTDGTLLSPMSVKRVKRAIVDELS